MALSYEFDPCDFLKATEFQLKRDVEGFRKSREDDLENMQTGIFGQKGQVHFEAAPCIDEWLGTLDPAMPKTDFFPLAAQYIDAAIHRSYRLFASNYVAADLLLGRADHAANYDEAARGAFASYLDERVAMASKKVAERGLQPDADFLRERILTMYANPLFNFEKASK